MYMSIHKITTTKQAISQHYTTVPEGIELHDLVRKVRIEIVHGVALTRIQNGWCGVELSPKQTLVIWTLF